MEKKPIQIKNGVDAIAECAVIESGLVKDGSWRATIDLRGIPVDYVHKDDLDPNVRTTCGIYGIKFIPKGRRFRNDRFPFVFINDMVNHRVCVGSSDHLRRVAEKIPEVKWILENSNYDPDLFRVAIRHQGMKIPFCLDWVKYENKLEDYLEKHPELKSRAPVLGNLAVRQDFKEELFGAKKIFIPNPNAYTKILNKLQKECANDYENMLKSKGVKE